MQYEESEFLKTANEDILSTISRARELIRAYYFTDYQDSEKEIQFFGNC